MAEVRGGNLQATLIFWFLNVVKHLTIALGLHGYH